MSASSASPSRLAKMKSESATDADKDYSGAGGVRRNYSSDYTSKRLEELRIRRAESAAESYADYKARREARENKAPALSSDYADYSSSRTTRLTGDSTTSATATTTTTTTSSLSSYTSSSKDSSALTRDLTSSRDLSETSSKSSTLSSRNGLEDEDDCIGFATLPDQVHRKAIKRGFDFTLMVVGEAGMGKSTLVSSLFLKDLYNDRQIRSVEEKVNRTVEIEKHYLEIEEKGVKLRLTIVDTPGFNDSLNGHESWKPITEYIEKQFDQYFKDESGLNRRNIKDNRVHCCLYFVSPLGHGLRQIDIQFMKRLHGLVNIVPVIAKADTLTPVELAKLKNRVLEEVEKHHIRIYEFPECDSDEDEEFQDMDKQLKASVPFAVIGSNHIADVNGKKVRARLYPWGIVEVDNNVHCDFGKLRQMLISTHMQDLKDITRDIHYENFRAKYIKEQMTKQQKERTKLKRDSMHGGDTEADKLLQQKDAELEKMRMMLSKMQEQLKGSGQVNGLGNL